MKIMTVIDEYVATLSGQEKSIIEHKNNIVRAMVPTATEETYYGMAAFKYKGKGLISILANKNFMSVYPYGNLERLGLDFSSFETTKGSIHFSPEKPISDELLKEILVARISQIEA